MGSDCTVMYRVVFARTRNLVGAAVVYHHRTVYLL